MIKIDKGETPMILKQADEDEQIRMEFYYDCSPVEYSNGEIKFEFSDDYHSPQVKAVLVERQNNKCCFSEARFVGDFSHVEHFRPKGRVDSEETNEKNYPGYYWLANNWSNLFLCKQLINVSYKRNFFPLTNDSIRNRNHHDLNREAPLLIDPGVDEPRDHIRFVMDEPVSISERGKATIELLGLRHPEFARVRRTWARHLIALKNVTNSLMQRLQSEGIKTLSPELKVSIQMLKEAMSPEAEFSSMAIDLLQDWPPLQLDFDLPENL